MKKYIGIFLMSLLSTVAVAQKKYNLIVGTYTAPGKSEGIYTYDFDIANGNTSLKNIAKGIPNPSYLAISPDKKHAYAVNETGDKSTVTAFKYEAKTGALTFLNKVESHGADPCFITVDDKNVLVANYSGGSLAVFSRSADGSLSEAIQVIKHTGKSIDPKGRQNSAHVHMVKFTPDHKYLVVNDLGEDQTYIYSYDLAGKEKTLTEKSVIRTNAGTGPRHIVFSPNGKFAYLVHEFNGSITAFRYKKGELTKLQEISTTLKDFKGAVDAADIHVSADGKFLYETNRGDANSISTFAILPTGKLKFIGTQSTLGKGPRNFTIDPSGKFLLVGHQYTNNVVIFNRDVKTGKLTDSGKRIDVGAPVCLIFDK
ncbi:beta-propeller fold lactonase family protein [Pedobacter petrophilus]|uniref:Beta-propeller fold lactonase family protein n=1 Tax=Pedobacter petrophilus TaxID=1908241 RepID=A0A7K0G1I4_9SPHI|nr:lactonase family protein [Pedobacter petrophilus]MRX77089.1 beta-propeller fold lactonase family protein [Pedobacter petrophilus]